MTACVFCVIRHHQSIVAMAVAMAGMVSVFKSRSTWTAVA